MRKGKLIISVLIAALFLLMIFAFVFNATMQSFVIDNSDTSNSLYERKLVRVQSFPYELLFGISVLILIFFLVDYDMKKLKKFDKRWVSLFLIILISSAFINFYLIDHWRISGQDEGFYVNSAKLIDEGETPYVDFVNYKGPGSYYVFSVLLGHDFTINNSRVILFSFKMLLLFLVSFFVFVLTWDAWASLVALLMVSTHFAMMGNFTTQHTATALYSLIILFGFLVFKSKMRSLYKVVLSTLIFSFAVSNRALVSPVIPLLLIYVYKEYDLKHVFASIITGITFILFVYVPFFVKDFSKASYGIVGWAFSRTASIAKHQYTDFFLFKADLLTTLGVVIDKLTTFVFSTSSNWLVYGVVIFAMAVMFKTREKDRLSWFMMTSFIVLIVISFLPKPTAIQYSFPFLPIGIVAGIAVLSNNKKHKALLIISLLALTVPITQYPRFLLEYRDGEAINSIDNLHEVSDYVKSITSEGDYITTFEIPITVEANRRVPHRMERGYWGYLPNITVEEANRLGVLNKEVYLEIITNRTGVLFIMSERKTGEFFGSLDAQTRTEIIRTISENYYHIKTFNNISDWGRVGVFMAR